MDDFLASWQETPEGQATYEMANLHPKRTGLPFVIFISQKDSYRHDVRVKVSPGPKVLSGQVSTYALRPFRHEGGPSLTTDQERDLERWIDKNRQVIIEYWDGDIDDTGDAISRIERV